MFLDEARIAAAVNHANVAKVFDLGAIDGLHYIAMEYVDGVDLSAVLRALRQREGRMPLEAALYIGRCVAEGLHAAHELVDRNGQPTNLVHRDVLSQAGPTFTARRGEANREFLVAGDAWFRPVSLYVGPDAALYVVDYYRARIEHPEWTATDAQRDPASMYMGQDRGRIYRVIRDPAGTGVPPPQSQAGSSPVRLAASAEATSVRLTATAEATAEGAAPARRPALGTAPSVSRGRTATQSSLARTPGTRCRRRSRARST